MFEWDEQKRQANIARGIDFVDVLPLFSRPDALIFEDNRKDYGETRYIMMCAVSGRLLQVAYA